MGVGEQDEGELLLNNEGIARWRKGGAMTADKGCKERMRVS